ncbi:hypothetical protein [Deinococcus hopiensis]|uniref:Uncharacterized protein n=1 Tax=Deinococcus hopiensis KR-140 TaxID=695939 RepID=A0A1W1UEB4_9DEIO|nr:hypothetical protein [Deinococcus hopiensis]SMB79382.1 hypothetical protein SAMN00790413_05907 [Deinococcus hopiensis KR-140]
MEGVFGSAVAFRRRDTGVNVESFAASFGRVQRRANRHLHRRRDGQFEDSGERQPVRGRIR